MKHCAIYPGSFDPLTFGHMDIIRRGLETFDTLYVAVAENAQKSPLFTAEERVEFIRQAFEGNPGVKVEPFDGLVVDYAKIKGAQVIIRGIRATSDFDYEFQMALMNRKMASTIQTVFLMPSEENFYISSTLIKEVTHLKGRVKDFVPSFVEEKLMQRLKDLGRSC